MLGAPSTDEGAAGSGGAFNHFAKDASIYWTAGPGRRSSAVRCGPGGWHSTRSGGSGFPTAGEVAVPGVAGAVKQVFANGEVYWSAATGARELLRWHGCGLDGGRGCDPPGAARRPVSPRYPGGRTRRTSPAATRSCGRPGGTRLVAGAIRDAWLARDGARGVLGLPTTDEASTPDAGGRFGEFAGGTVVWTSSAGAVVLTGAIGTRWSTDGGVDSSLGLPVGAQRATSDGRGQYVRFASGAQIFQTTGATRAFLVRGGIGDRGRRWAGSPGWVCR